MMPHLYTNYLKKIKETYLSGDATEPSYYPALKELLENFAPKKKTRTLNQWFPTIKVPRNNPIRFTKSKDGKIKSKWMKFEGFNYLKKEISWRIKNK